MHIHDILLGVRVEDDLRSFNNPIWTEVAGALQREDGTHKGPVDEIG